jgi:competence protein ComEA
MTYHSIRLFVRCSLAVLGLAAALASVAPELASAQEHRPAAAQAPAAATVNIQTATSEQLQLLPGIGPSKAQAIVTYREHHAFRAVDDIMHVRGIGRATFRRLRPMLTVQGPTTMTERVRPSGSRPAAESSD